MGVPGDQRAAGRRRGHCQAPTPTETYEPQQASDASRTARTVQADAAGAIPRGHHAGRGVLPHRRRASTPSARCEYETCPDALADRPAQRGEFIGKARGRSGSARSATRCRSPRTSSAGSSTTPATRRSSTWTPTGRTAYLTWDWIRPQTTRHTDRHRVRPQVPPASSSAVGRPAPMGQELRDAALLRRPADRRSSSRPERTALSHPPTATRSENVMSDMWASAAADWGYRSNIRVPALDGLDCPRRTGGGGGTGGGGTAAGAWRCGKAPGRAAAPAGALAMEAAACECHHGCHECHDHGHAGHECHCHPKESGRRGGAAAYGKRSGHGGWRFGIAPARRHARLEESRPSRPALRRVDRPAAWGRR